jgi:probable phosphoglycerate mutase
LCHVFVSPRQRAYKTFELLFAKAGVPKHQVTEDVREWDYGDYEGLKPDEIRARDKYWSIWRTG